MNKMRIMSAVAAAITALGCTASPAFAETAQQCGDVNGDGKITVSDAVLIARINAEDSTLKISDAARTAADVNESGGIDQNDLSDLLQYIAGLRSSLNGKAAEEHVFAAQNLMKDYSAKTLPEAAQADGFRAAQLDFTANMLKEVAKQEGTAENMLISPYSIAMALGMTANGAKGDTLAEMEKVLGGGLHLNDLNESYRSILAQTVSKEQAKTYGEGDFEYKEASLDIANSIWYHQDPDRIQVPAQFLQNTADIFGASAYAAKDFDIPVIQDINYWVKQNTHDMIDSILPEKPLPTAVMVLVNALAFEGDWTEPFEDVAVREESFTRADGSECKADMMHGSEPYYYEADGAVGFKKTYVGDNYSFIAVLPDKDISIDDYISNLDGKKLEKFLGSETTEYDVYTALPKFTYDFGAKLNDPLKNMGMPSAFDEAAADFSGLNEAEGEQTHISDVLHKTHIELDQKGTRAAAVTAVVLTNESVAMPRESRTVTLDRPFVYMIYDEKAELPVFIGTVMEPGTSE